LKALGLGVDDDLDMAFFALGRDLIQCIHHLLRR
jgi:hypothetical protein